MFEQLRTHLMIARLFVGVNVAVSHNTRLHLLVIANVEQHE